MAVNRNRDHWRWLARGVAGIASQVCGVLAGVSLFVAIRHDAARFLALAVVAIVAAILFAAIDRAHGNGSR